MTHEHCLILLRRVEDLQQSLNPSDDFLEYLVKTGVFSEKENNSVKEMSSCSYSAMARKVVYILAYKPDCVFDKFIEALMATYQENVVHILTGKDEPTLSRIRRTVLQEVEECKVFEISVCDTSLVARLHEKGVIDDRCQQLIKTEMTLFDVVNRMSHSSYAKFMQVLKRSGNEYVAQFGANLEKRLEEEQLFEYRPWPLRLQSSLPMSKVVFGVTQCDNKLFGVSYMTSTISVFELNSNNKQLTDIKLEEMKTPTDIVACTETKHLYVAGASHDSTVCVWRVSLDSRQVVKWLPNYLTTASQFTPYTLSVTSRRLLVTSKNDNQLCLYGVDGVELKRVPLPDMAPSHSVETMRGTFIVSHNRPQPGVSEVNVDGHVIRVCSDQQLFGRPDYLSLDSEGRIFVADYNNNKQRVLLLNSRLQLERIAQQPHKTPIYLFVQRLCYIEQTAQLAFGVTSGIYSDWIELLEVKI